MKKANGVLAKALRIEINIRDMGLKEVAGEVNRSVRVVNMVLAGEKVSDKTIAQFEKAFPSIFA